MAAFANETVLSVSQDETELGGFADETGLSVLVVDDHSTFAELLSDAINREPDRGLRPHVGRSERQEPGQSGPGPADHDGGDAR